MHSHRSTLKQQNKPFKSRHSTKGSIKASAKGKIQSSTQGKKMVASVKADRRNAAKMLQKTKQAAALQNTRIFQGTHAAPKVVAVIPLCPDSDTSSVCSLFGPIEQGLVTIETKFKTKAQFIPLPRDLLSILEAVKVADILLFCLSAKEEVDAFGENVLSCIKAQGVPIVMPFVQYLDQPPKEQNNIKKSLLYYMNHQFPDQQRLYSEKEVDLLSRHISTAYKPVQWRDRHAWMVSNKIAYDQGTLAVSGYVRGSHLNVNRLIHIPNVGDFQISRIEHGAITYEPNETQEPLVMANEPDPMDAEQTWPTEEEIQEAEARIKKVPKGTSSYQAAWISDDENDDLSEVSDDGFDERMQDDDMEQTHEEEFDEEEYEEFEEVEEEIRDLNQNEFDDEEEERQREYLLKSELKFPDEIDTPRDIPARVRFQRYRGLKSFHSSPWDPYENLPVDYSRIFSFSNFKRTKKRVMEELDQGIAPGSYVTIYLKDVPPISTPFITLFSLLSHERKMTVLNFVIERKVDDGPIASKDPMILMCGFRRYLVEPIYSTYTRGGSNNVHKYERFLIPGRASVGTVYAPVQFGPAPILMFRPDMTFVGSGSVLDADPLRIVAKRIILTGHPFKVHKRSAVIRHMFFSPQDVLYFKPVQVSTKYGRIGHIKESLGTHGYMKCAFDGPIKQHDTVCMHLYKRVFPKWTTQLTVDSMMQ